MIDLYFKKERHFIILRVNIGGTIPTTGYDQQFLKSNLIMGHCTHIFSEAPPQFLISFLPHLLSSKYVILQKSKRKKVIF
jgi:hypothetical protein